MKKSAPQKGGPIDAEALQALVRAAVDFNKSNSKR